MKSASQFSIVLVTAPDIKVARQLAALALKARLAACANLVPAVESHYWWRGKIERGTEVLVIFKTARRRLPALEKLILTNHPYDTPEFLVLPLQSGSERYLKWLADSVMDLPSDRALGTSQPPVGHSPSERRPPLPIR